MGRRSSLAIAVMIATLPVVGQAQMRAPGPQMPDAPGDAGQLYEEVEVLRTIRTLELTADQLVELTGINSRVIAEEEDLERLREDLWEQYEDDIETVLDAWVAGEEAPNRANTAADRAINRVDEAEADLRNARRTATEALYGILGEDQRDLVESPGAAEDRAARAARMGGVESVGEYVVAQLDALRDLMPEEFDMLAAAEAERIAAAIEGANASNLAGTRDAVLDVLVEVYNWTPERYQRQRPTLDAQVDDALGFPTDDERPPVSWSALTLAAASDRTPAAVEAVTPDDDAEAEVE